MPKITEMNNNTSTEYIEIPTEMWELIRVRNKLERHQDKHSEDYKSYAYILLNKRRETDNTHNDEFFVNIIPLIEVFRSRWSHLWNIKATWSVHANLDKPFRQIKFANFENFQIQDVKLRGRGLGSYVLSDLVQWVKQNYSTFTIKSIYVNSFDRRSESGEKLGNALNLYRKVGFRIENENLEEGTGKAVAENAYALFEHRDASQVESIAIESSIDELEKRCELQIVKSKLEK